MFLDENVCFRFWCLCSTAQGTCSPESFPVPRRLSPEMDRTAQDQGAAREGSRRPQQGGPRSQGMARLCLGIITRTDTTRGPSMDDGSTVCQPSPFPSQVNYVPVPRPSLLLLFLILLPGSSLNPWAQGTLLYTPTHLSPPL